MNHLPYDCARCQGVLFHSGDIPRICESRKTCKRYLSREHVGERTPFLSVPISNVKGKCNDYWEHKE